MLFCMFCCTSNAQSPAWPVVVRNTDSLWQMIMANGENEMVDLRSVIPQLLLDLRYAIDSNFTHQVLYRDATTSFLRKPAAIALKQAAKKLRRRGYLLKVWDAYRPYAATQKMWELVPDERYAANPRNGSGHNRGIAVDLTLLQKSNGKEVDMGTGFDHFSDTAHVNFTGLSRTQKRNRKMLQKQMEAAGFKVLTTEWWHFYLPNANQFAVLDIPFEKMKKMTRGK